MGFLIRLQLKKVNACIAKRITETKHSIYYYI